MSEKFMKEVPKKFIIAPACTDLNRGDQALVWESAKLLEDTFGSDTDIKIVDYGNTPEERARQSAQTRAAGYNVIRNLVENPKRSIPNAHHHLGLIAYLKVASTALIDLFQQIILFALPYNLVATLTLRDSMKFNSFEALKVSDCVVIKGGGFVHTYGDLQDPYYLWFNLYYAILALRLGKKVIIFPNSFGPIKGKINRIMLRAIINRCELVYAREKKSFECLKNIGCKNVKLSHDLAYHALKKDCLPGSLDFLRQDKRKIGVTVRPYRFPESKKPLQSYEKYIESIAGFCDATQEYDIYFIVQVQGPSAHEDDRIAIKDVLKKCKRTDVKVIDGSYDYSDLISIYSHFDFLVGTRFHSVIFSQISGVPTLAIAYGGNKTAGIMKEVGLEDFVIDINNISEDKLTYKFRELVKYRKDHQEKIAAFMARLLVLRIGISDDLKRAFM